MGAKDGHSAIQAWQKATELREDGLVPGKVGVFEMELTPFGARKLIVRDAETTEILIYCECSKADVNLILEALGVVLDKSSSDVVKSLRKDGMDMLSAGQVAALACKDART